MSMTCPDSKNVFLVGGIPTPLKNMSSSIGIIIPNIWKKYIKKHQPLLLYPKILRFDTVYHHFPLQVWGIRHFWTNKNVAEGEKKGNRWAFHTKQETCSSVGFDFPEEECNMMGRKIMFQIENGRI